MSQGSRSSGGGARSGAGGGPRHRRPLLQPPRYEVVRVALPPRPVRLLPPRHLARRRRAHVLPIANARIRMEPSTADPARPRATRRPSVAPRPPSRPARPPPARSRTRRRRARRDYRQPGGEPVFATRGGSILDYEARAEPRRHGRPQPPQWPSWSEVVDGPACLRQPPGCASVAPRAPRNGGDCRRC